jgi:hypothetical protein
MALTLAHIQTALALPPLGRRSDFDLNPEVKAAQIPGLEQRPAAVLCGLIERAGGLHVVLTMRAAHLNQHAGQISFPVAIIGTLDQYLTSTGFRVTPFVGIIDPRWNPLPDPNEVEEVFETPLDFLMDPANRVRHHHDRWGTRRYYYAMPWGDYYIWGATAGMLKGLSDRLALLAEQGAK